MEKLHFFVLCAVLLFLHSSTRCSYLARELEKAKAKITTLVQEHKDQKQELIQLRHQLTSYEAQRQNEQVAAQQREQGLQARIEELNISVQTLQLQQATLQQTCYQQKQLIAQAQTVLHNCFKN